MPIADAILEGIGFTIGGKVVDHVHKKMMGKKRKNSGSSKSEFIGVRVNSSKIQLKLPNRNPGTLRQAKAVASKLGYKINTSKSKEELESRLHKLYEMAQDAGYSIARRKEIIKELRRVRRELIKKRRE